jgi:predicted RNA methylase
MKNENPTTTEAIDYEKLVDKIVVMEYLVTKLRADSVDIQAKVLKAVESMKQKFKEACGVHFERMLELEAEKTSVVNQLSVFKEKLPKTYMNRIKLSKEAMIWAAILAYGSQPDQSAASMMVMSVLIIRQHDDPEAPLYIQDVLERAVITGNMLTFTQAKSLSEVFASARS